MQIYSMGEGIMEESAKDMEGKPCILLVCDSRDELSDALRGIGFRDRVTVVRSSSEPNGEELQEKKA